MRLKKEEIEIIKTTVQKHLPGTDVYLFGSRVDDSKRGGDIDILIIGDAERDYDKLRGIRIELNNRLGEQKIDVVYEQRAVMSPFGKLALMDGAQI